MSSDDPLFLVDYPHWTRLLKLMLKPLDLTIKTGECVGFPLEADKGCGKTTLFATFISQFPPRYETPTGTVIPDLYVNTPSNATPRALGSATLFALGDPAFDKGNAEGMKMRIANLCTRCGVERLYFDDFQHLVDSNNDNVLHYASDWFKSLIKLIGKPVFVSGLPEKVRRVLKFNPQLGRLFMSTQTLNPFPWTAERKTQIQFKIIVIKLVEHYGIPLSTEKPESEILHRIHYATGGNFANVKNLLLFATDVAHEQSKEFITLKILTAAFDDRLRDTSTAKFNPFKAGLHGNLPRLPEEKSEK